MSILPKEYENYLKFFRFIIKYWNSNILYESGQLKEEDEIAEWSHSPEELVKDLKKMGPTYIKLGQLLSTRPDMLPKEYLEELARLQDEVDTIPYEEIEKLFQQEIGERISKAFKSFDKQPLAAASIGQVHKAILHSGKEVAVKFQRPGIRKHFIEDFNVLMNLAEKAEHLSKKSENFSMSKILEEMQYILLQELDYTKEAENLTVLKRNLKEFDHLEVPGIIKDYCSEKVLTMEFVDGQKSTTLSPFQLDNIDRDKLITQFVKAYLKQIIVDGFAHADPHPGNIHITKEGKIALMDLGMVARFDDQLREYILRLMIGMGDNDGVQVTRVLLDMSDYDDEKTDVNDFKKQVVRKIQENKNQKAEDLKTGQSILEINKIAIQQDIRLPVEFVSLGKILLNMDQIIAVLAPEYELQKTVKKYIEHLLRKRMFQEAGSGNILQGILESKELMSQLPYRLNRITEDLANHKLKLQMDVIDERRFLIAFQKVANRITAGLVIAALILGAAVIMHIPTSWQILGYPGFAVLLFVFAALIGFYLVYQILFKDQNEHAE